MLAVSVLAGERQVCRHVGSVGFNWGETGV